MGITTDGNLGSSLTAQQANNWRMAYNQRRGLQGSETAAIERYTVSEADPAAGITGTETQVAGLTGLSVLVEDMTEEFAKSIGERWESGAKVFWFIPASSAQVALETDFILWTPMGTGSQTRWQPTSIAVHKVGSEYLFCRVAAKRAPRP